MVDNYIDEMLKTEAKIPKSPEEYLKMMCDRLKQVFDTLGKQKSDPLVQLYKANLLDVDKLINEAVLIQQKRSTLSATKRAAVVSMVRSAVQQFDKLQKQQLSEDNQQKSTDEAPK